MSEPTITQSAAGLPEPAPNLAPPVQTGTAAPVVKPPKDPAPVKRAPSVPKWESAARDRVKAAIRRYNKPLSDLVARDANEGDTRLFITDFLCDGLGFDKYEDLTTEYQVKGEFADYGVRIDKQLIAFIEVKRCATKLSERHLRQVQMYAVNEGVEWMILTNGQVWQAYHLTGGLPVVIDIALEVDLLGESTLGQKADSLFYLTREAMKRNRLDDLWKVRKATSPTSIASVLLSDSVVDAVRKELRKRTGHNAESAEIARVLRSEIVRSDLHDGGAIPHSNAR